MDLMDHLPEPDPVEPTIMDRIHEEIGYGDMEAASVLMTGMMQDFFLDYINEPSLYGLLKIANHIQIDNRDDTKVLFNIKVRKISIPYMVALKIESGHDIAFLLLVERARLLVGRSIHTYCPDDMDLKQVSHKAIYDLTLSSWAHALSRCYCASTLPEKLYGMIPDLYHNLLHGLAPDQLSKAIAKKFPNVSSGYLSLYNMGGQEQYHAALNRIASTNTITIPFNVILDLYWEDFKKNAPTNKEIEDMIEALLVQNADDDEEERGPENLQELREAMKKLGGRSNRGLSLVPTVDVDVETDLDQYLAQFMKATFDNKEHYWHDPLHGMGSLSPSRDKIRVGFDSLQHTVMLEANHNEDDGVFGSLTPPDHPSARDLNMYMQGYPPMLWETKMSSGVAKTPDIRYAIYFDISGSMYRWLPVVRALIRALGIYVMPGCVYGFSDVVVDISMDESFFMTTGGTHIASTTEHARKNGITHMIVITDLGDSTQVNTEGIEHVIIVATDFRGNSVAGTVFSQHKPSTKVDMYPVNYSDLVQRTSDSASFNEIDEALGI